MSPTAQLPDPARPEPAGPVPRPAWVRSVLGAAAVVVVLGGIWTSASLWTWGQAMPAPSRAPSLMAAGNGPLDIATPADPTAAFSASERVQMSMGWASAGWGGRGDASAVADTVGRVGPDTEVGPIWIVAVLSVVASAVLLVVLAFARRYRRDRSVERAGRPMMGDARR